MNETTKKILFYILLIGNWGAGDCTCDCDSWTSDDDCVCVGIIERIR